MIRDYLVRFSLRQRLEHFAVMILFIVLSGTGFPQKFYETGWARWLVGFMGGVEGARVIHRWAGIIFSVLTVLHLSIATFLVATGKSLPSLVPTRKDFRDGVTTLRYYLGLTEDQARFDRFDYRQKFEYWGLVFGGVVMIGTGLVLYFRLPLNSA